MRIFFSIFWLLGFSFLGFSHPVSFEGGTQAMFHFNENSPSLRVFHSFTSRDAFGLHSIRIKGERSDEFWNLLQYNRLFHRWNARDYQANIYAGLGIGTQKEFGKAQHFASLAMLKSDYETRHFFLGNRLVWLESEKSSHLLSSIEMGWSPYLAKENEFSFWFMLEWGRISRTQNKEDIIPKIRFFNGEIFSEFGISLDGKPHFFLMKHF